MPRNGLSITDVRVRDYAGRLTRPFVTARRRVDEVAGVVVEVELDDGTVGLGSAAETLAVTGESVDSIRTVLHGPITEALTGAHPERGLRGHADSIASSCTGNTSAKAAADVALHDAWARGLGVPLAEALGGNPGSVLHTDMTVSLDHPDAMARAALAAFDDGFTVLKIKLGDDWRADLERLEAVRDAVPAARFRLDANQGWDAKSAVRIIRALEDARIPVQLVEQPVPEQDLAGLAAVAAAVDVPIMADEALNSPRDAFEIARAGAADLFNIKLAECGGVGHAMAIADIARAAGIQCMIGAMMEPRISIAAAAHVAAAHPAITLVDLDSAEWIDEHELLEGYALHGDELRLAHAPGARFREIIDGKESTMRGLQVVTAVLGAALLCSTGATAAAAPASESLEAGDHAFVDVTAATLWVEPGTARELDAPSLTNPVDLDQWNANMPDAETRRWLTGKLESQAVLGSEVEIIEISGEWAHVVVLDQPTPRDDRGYPGWVPVTQLVENDEFARQVENLPWAQVTANRTWLTDTPVGRHRRQELSFNTRLPVLSTTPDALRVALPDGATAWLDRDAADVYASGSGPAHPTGQDLVDTGRKFLGLRYLWAGVSAFGFDCSGFTYTIHRAHGVTIPRDASAQSEVGTEVAVPDLRPGDLLFFAQPGGEGFVHHVGMYLGDGKMIHSPNASSSVSIVNWQQWDVNDEFADAKRML